MLDIETLQCRNEKFHKDCQWVHAKLRYPDGRYLMVKNTLMHEVQKTHIAYRIVHDRFGVLTTIKYGHDGNLFISDNNEALKRFAVF